MKRPLHRLAHATCEYGAANWAECDRQRDHAYADWQAMQQVILAYNIVVSGRRIKDDNALADLIDYIAGDTRDMLDKKGNPAQSAWVKRLRAAIERFKAGDLPGYNLYEPVAPAHTEGG